MQISLKGLEPGQNYVLQARSKGTNGQVSAWSTAYNLLTQSDVTAPSPVTALSFDNVGTAFKASWTAPTTDSDGKNLKDFKDYQITIDSGSDTEIYFTTATHFDFTFENNVNAFGQPEPNLTITVKARDLAGNLSTGVSDSASNPIPANLTGFDAAPMIGGVYLKWDQTIEDDFKQYKVWASTSSGFIPDDSTLVYVGSATNFLFASNNPVVYYFKAKQFDVFNQESVAFATDSATPETSTDMDVTPAAAPTNVHVDTQIASDGSAILGVSWDAVVDTKLSDYVVMYQIVGGDKQFITVPYDTTSTIITGLAPGEEYNVAVASETFANVKSTFTTAVESPITTEVDSTAPSQPSAPTVSTNTMSVQISHNMTKQSGGFLEADVAYLEVHRGTTSTFTTSSTTLRETIDSGGQGIAVSKIISAPVVDTDTTVYWRVIAVDKFNNKSIASNAVSGVPGLIQSVNIADATITSAKIDSLEANKIIAGTGIVNDLTVKSNLTLGTGGHVKSSDFNAGTQTGFDLSTGGLAIYDGNIAAKALLLQDSNNIMPPAWADFEFNSTYYYDSTNTVLSTIGSATSGVSLLIDSVNQKFNRQCMRVYNTTITNPTVHDLYFAPGGASATGVNINVDPGDYIISGWFKKNGTPNQTVKFGLYTDTSVAITSTINNITSASWTRFSAVLTVPSGVQKVKAYIEFGPQAANTGYDFLVDGMMLERKLTASTTPSAFKPPSSTAIDGGQIVTGSIRSNALSSTQPDQPAWSINTAGNMQVGDALVRGTLVVGNYNDSFLNMMPTQFATFEKTSSYYHDVSNNPNTANFSPGSGIKAQILSTGAQAGTQCLRVWNPATTTSQGIYLSNSAANAAGTNVGVISGQTYMVSAYVKSGDATKSFTAGLAVWSTSGFGGVNPPEFENVAVTSTSTWTRIYGTWKASAGISRVQVAVFINVTSGTGYDIVIDSVMVEPLQNGQTTPSAFSDGSVGYSNISSGNYSSGQSGWRIDNYGNAEFNNGTFRGELDIIATLAGSQVRTNISNSSSSWKTYTIREDNANIPVTLSGTEPAIKMFGTQFFAKPDGTTYALKDTQAVLRMTPEGGLQLISDGSRDTTIFDSDGNNDYTTAPTLINKYYSYGDLRIGPGYDRNMGSTVFNSNYSTLGDIPDNLMYGQLHTKSNSKIDATTGYGLATADVETRVNTSNNGDFRPFSQTELSTLTQVVGTSGNIMPLNYDTLNQTISYYQTNSTRNRISLDSIGTKSFSLAGDVVTTKVINCTLQSAGSAQGIVYFAPTATTYNISVQPGEKYMMSITGVFATGLTTGVDFQYFMQCSNGTVLTSNMIDLAGMDTDPLLNIIPMNAQTPFVIPAGVTSVNVGFYMWGTWATNYTFSIGRIQVQKIANADGTQTGNFSPYVFMTKNQLVNGQGRSYVQLVSNGYPSSISSQDHPQVLIGADLNDAIANNYTYANLLVDVNDGVSIWADTDLKAVINSVSAIWTLMTIQNGGSIALSTQPQFRVTVDNKVILKGAVNGGTLTSGTTICTLPAGYRPLAEYQQIVASTSASNTGCKIRILTTGEIQYAATNANAGVNLNGIEFPLY